MADKELLLHLQTCFEQCKPVFIALGDEVRLAIVTALAWTALTGRSASAGKGSSLENSLPAPQGMSVKEITNTTKLSRPAISHHLKILKNAGLVDSVQTGTSNIYYLTFDASIELLYDLGMTLYKIKGRHE